MFSTYLKATIAGAIAGLGLVISGYDDNNLAVPEILGALVGALTMFSAVWATPNQP